MVFMSTRSDYIAIVGGFFWFLIVINTIYISTDTEYFTL